MKADKMPELTKANIENLLDAPYGCVLVYDYRVGTMNKLAYAGYSSGVAHVYADKARLAIEGMPEFGGRKVVLAAIQGVPEASWPGVGKFERYPLNNERSVFVMGNVIAFNPKTGLYEANPAGWMGVDVPELVVRREYMGLQKFLYDMWAREQERRKFVASFKTK